MKNALLVLGLFFLTISVLYILKQQVSVRSQNETASLSAQTSSAASTLPSQQISPSTAPQQQFSGGSGGGDQAPTPTPTPFSANPYNVTPLPVDRGGPENDIVESTPLTASRASAQVDDFITFSAGIKNIAPYKKSILSLCFESSDGNFGCVWGIELASGQTYNLQNAGSWVTGGNKTVWITWTQDRQNYYLPLQSNTVTVHILN